MPMCSATRRASYTSSSEQQRPRTDWGMPSYPASRLWFQSCMVSPMTLCPSARSMAATAEESTPPDMATAMVLGFVMLRVNSLLLVHWRQFSQPRHGLRHQRQRDVDILRSVLLPQAEPNAAMRAIASQAHGR